MSITILKPGISSSIQDLGRWGLQQYGIPISGAMDEYAARRANIFCGNEEEEPVIEITLHGAEIMFNEAACISITGSGSIIYLNDIEIEYNRLIKLDAFSILKFKPSATGCRSYLAIQGGLDIRKEMGSCSTFAPSGIGGINGQLLKTGDIIPFSRKESFHKKANEIIITKNGFAASTWIGVNLKEAKQQRVTKIKICDGPEWNLFHEQNQNTFLSNEYTISLKANRMGIQLEGARLELLEKKEMISSAVTKGIIQITNEGLPIVLMADAQTTGGYPRIARVCSADISTLAQCRPGDKISLEKISEQESIEKRNQLNQYLKYLRKGLHSF
jgi:antagonist of KipI